MMIGGSSVTLPLVSINKFWLSYFEFKYSGKYVFYFIFFHFAYIVLPAGGKKTHAELILFAFLI